MRIHTTIAGNATGDAELTFSNSGVAYAKVNVAVTDRAFNKETKEWGDGDTTYYRVTAFKKLAENMAESVERGDRVTVTGNLSSALAVTKEGTPWLDKEGQPRVNHDIIADDVALSVKFGPVKSERAKYAHNQDNQAPAQAPVDTASVPF